MDVRKTIAELTSQLAEVNYDSEEDNVVLKDSPHAPNDSNLLLDNFEISPSKLRKTTDLPVLPGNIYGGKKTSRNKCILESSSVNFQTTNSSDDESLINSSEDAIESNNGSESEEELSEQEGLSEQEELSEQEGLSEQEESQAKSSNKSRVEGSADGCNIYSAGSKNISNDLKKGTAIKNQLRIWESLLECRIKLQKGITACNSLPSLHNLQKAKIRLDSENQLKFNKCKKSLLSLLERMVNLQTDQMERCCQLKKQKLLSSRVMEDDEIKSDESSIEDDLQENEDDQKDNQDHPHPKKRKLNDYSFIIKSNHEKFVPFRNASIQKWNDKTKVSTGKMANSNFSAFDQSTLKQIEQIMSDKRRLINRTRVRRSENQSLSGINNIKLEQDLQDSTLDPQIFDDTDFYHKLLRDYIERKSVDITSSSHTERQMIELQKLRSKMKKAIDTRSTKGRKLRYIVLPKLVNFMAPHPYNSWSEQAETELYSSLFGKTKISY